MSRPHRAVLPIVAGVLAATLAACSGGTATGSGSSTSSTSDRPSEESVSSQPASPTPSSSLAALATLDSAELEAELARLSSSLERELWAQSGLDAELGGADKADAAFAAVNAALIAQAQALRDDPTFGRFGGGIPAAEEITLGGGIFAGWMVAGIGATAVVNATNSLKPGERPAPERRGDAGNTTVIGGTLEKGSLTSTLEKTIDGVTGKVKTDVDISPCPTADGTFTGKVVIDASATTENGRTGTNMTTEITITGRVGDDAELIGLDSESRTQAADFRASKGSYVDVWSKTSFVGSKATAQTQGQNRAGGKATPKMAQEWAGMSMVNEILIGDFLARAAEEGWKSGRCVDVQVTTSPEKRTGLAPSTTVDLTAAPKSKIDQAATGGTVTAGLNGQTSIDPANSPVPADASFTFVAPGEKDLVATVALVATSKRGIGKAEVRFDTRASRGYFIGPTTGGSHRTVGLGIGSTDDGGSMGTAEPADVCDITVPFTLTAPSTGGRQTFTPTSATGGTTTYQTTMPMTGFTETGKGTYTLSLDGDGGTIRTKVRGRLTLPGGAQSYKTSATQIFTLQPTTNCS